MHVSKDVCAKSSEYVPLGHGLHEYVQLLSTPVTCVVTLVTLTRPDAGIVIVVVFVVAITIGAVAVNTCPMTDVMENSETDDPVNAVVNIPVAYTSSVPVVQVLMLVWFIAKPWIKLIESTIQ